MIGFGSQASARCVIRTHVMQSLWLRRRSVRRQRSTTWCRNGQCTGVGWHCVIAEVATNDVPQPFPLIGEWLVHALPQLLFDHPQLRPHAISPGLPFDLEFALAGLAADEGEAQEVEGLRSAEPTPLAAFRRKASELDEPGLLGMQCQRELP